MAGSGNRTRVARFVVERLNPLHYPSTVGRKHTMTRTQYSLSSLTHAHIHTHTHEDEEGLGSGLCPSPCAPLNLSGNESRREESEPRQNPTPVSCWIKWRSNATRKSSHRSYRPNTWLTLAAVPEPQPNLTDTTGRQKHVTIFFVAIKWCHSSTPAA